MKAGWCFLAVFVIACDARSSPGYVPADSAAAPPVATTDPDSAPNGFTPAAVRDSATAAAVSVLRDYYAALNQRDFPRAFAAWGDAGPPNAPTVAEFTSQYASTDSIGLAVGEPGRMEGAAGSRYIDVPIRLRVYQDGRALPEQVGTAVMRRGVVPGVSEANGRWHLYRLSLGGNDPDQP